MLTLLTLLIACFSQLDIVKHAPLLDSLEETPERQDVELQTQAFLGSVLQSILPVVAKAELRVITGLLGLLLDRTNIVVSGQTRVGVSSLILRRLLIACTQLGIAMLTLFLSRIEIIKQGMSSAQEPSEIPTPEEAQQWYAYFQLLNWSTLIYDRLQANHFRSFIPAFDALFRALISLDSSCYPTLPCSDFPSPYGYPRPARLAIPRCTCTPRISRPTIDPRHLPP